MLLAGDIGGTKTDLAIYTPKSGPHAPIVYKRFHSSDYSSLQEIVTEFLSEVALPIDGACFDVAGPVIGGRVKTTNLPWVLDEEDLEHDLGLGSVRLLNDLQAVAYAVPVLSPSDSVTIYEGEPIEHAGIAVIAPGTGLGEAFLTWHRDQYVANSSEGGHAGFAPVDEKELGLLQYMSDRYDHVSVERVCSGIGIPNIYSYLRDVQRIPERPDLAEQLAISSDVTRSIVGAALSPTPSPLCQATVEMFVSILASEAGNLTLKVLGLGGLYLTGSLAVNLLPFLKRPRFLNHFRNKGRLSELMRRVPVRVITSKAALVGAAAYGLDNAAHGENRNEEQQSAIAVVKE
jgi:glucokinase